MIGEDRNMWNEYHVDYMRVSVDEWNMKLMRVSADEWNMKLSAPRRCLRCHECKKKFQADCLKINNSWIEYQIYQSWHTNRTEKKQTI